MHGKWLVATIVYLTVVLHLVLWDLSYFQQVELVLVLDQGPALHVRPRLVRHLHHELAGGLRVGRVDQEVEDGC